MHTSSQQTFHFTVDMILLYKPSINMESAQAKILLSVYIQTTCYHNFKREQKPDIFNSIFSFKCVHSKQNETQNLQVQQIQISFSLVLLEF